MNIEVCVPSRTLNNRAGLGLDPELSKPILEAVHKLNDGGNFDSFITFNKNQFNKAFRNVDLNTSHAIWTKLTEDYPCSTH